MNQSRPGVGFRRINYYQIWVPATSRPWQQSLSAFGKLRLAHPARHCLSPPKEVFFSWLLGQFWGPLAIKEDMSGLFRSLDNSNRAKNNHSTPVWSLIQAYLSFEPIVSRCGLPTHKLLSTLTLGPFAQPHPQFSSEHTDWFSWTVSLISRLLYVRTYVKTSEIHTETRLVRKTCTLELDFKRASNGCFWLDLRYLKTWKGQTCLPLLPEVLKTAPAVMKKNFFWGG